MEEFINEFRAEATGIVSDVQQYLLTLENNKKDRSLVDEVFRGVHSLKGSSRMFGFEKIEKLTHELENSFDEVREGNLELNSSLINLGLEVMDAVLKVLDDSITPDEYQELILRLSDTDQEVVENSADTSEGVYQILYNPNEDIYKRGIKPLTVLDELEEIGETLVHILYQGPSFEDQEAKKSFESKIEILIDLNGSYEDLEDVFLFMDDDEYLITAITSDEEESILDLNEGIKKILNGLPADLDFTNERKEFIETHLKNTDQPKDTVEELEVIEEDSTKDETPVIKENPVKDSGISFVNVRLERLDQMMRLLSELVTVKAELSYRAKELDDQKLINSVEKLEKISTKFKDNAFSMRLVPLQILSVKLQRLIRDVSSRLGKEVKLITEGLDTEIDKSIISEIEAPLVHIIQNAIDHGLEDPEERVAKGKDPVGIIKIVAFYAGASVFIMVQDDGKGLNVEKIRQKAISKGFIKPDEILSDKDITDLIFKPGFTTHNEATEYSGRGVGMDVVNQKIKLLRGSIEVTTEPDLGSSFTIRLPLSLSIIDVLHFRIQDINYLLPQSEIDQCFSERLHSSIISRNGHNLKYNGKLIPHFDLIDFFEKTNDEESDNAIIITKKNEECISLEVEEIVGYTQLVVKPMDEVFEDLPYLTGVSVLGNGDLAFVLDPLKLREYANKNSQRV